RKIYLIAVLVLVIAGAVYLGSAKPVLGRTVHALQGADTNCDACEDQRGALSATGASARRATILKEPWATSAAGRAGGRIAPQRATYPRASTCTYGPCAAFAL